MKRSLLLLLLLFIALIAGLSIMRSRAVPRGIGTEPSIVSFTATPLDAHAGEPVVLAWNARGADSLTLSRSTSERDEADEPERTRLPGSGKIVVHPNEDTVYRLTCETADGPMCTTTVTVHAK
jgi:hypothetical protein